MGGFYTAIVMVMEVVLEVVIEVVLEVAMMLVLVMVILAMNILFTHTQNIIYILYLHVTRKRKDIITTNC